MVLAEAVYTDSFYNFEGIYKPPEVLEYRNKMEYSFGDEVKDGPLTCGLHKYGSHYDIVTATDCKIVDRDFRFLLEESIRFFKDRGVTYYHKNTGEGYLRHLLVRKSKETGDILIALVTTGNYLTQSGDTDKKNEEELLKDYTERILHFNEINSLNGQIAGVIQSIPAQVWQEEVSDYLTPVMNCLVQESGEDTLKVGSLSAKVETVTYRIPPEKMGGLVSSLLNVLANDKVVETILESDAVSNILGFVSMITGQNAPSDGSAILKQYRSTLEEAAKTKISGIPGISLTLQKGTDKSAAGIAATMEYAAALCMVIMLFETQTTRSTSGASR